MRPSTCGRHSRRGRAIVCHRMSPLLLSELREALDELRRSGHARVPRRDSRAKVPDAYPGSQVPLLVPDGEGGLVPTELTWGFSMEREGRRRLAFNTRIETALKQARDGEGLWAQAIREGRCLVPVRGFWERRTEPRPRTTDEDGGTPAPEVRFGLAGHRVFLLAGVQAEGRFSVVTTRPNAVVAPVHNRMPLVLGPGESHVWLGPDYAGLADRSSVRLTRAGTTSEVEAT